jgi:hypothetical protein
MMLQSSAAQGQRVGTLVATEAALAVRRTRQRLADAPGSTGRAISSSASLVKLPGSFTANLAGALYLWA